MVQLTKPICFLFDLDNNLYGYDTCHEPAIQEVYVLLGSKFNLPEQKSKEFYSEAKKIVKKRVGELACSHSRLLYFNALIELAGFGAQPVEVLELEQVYWSHFLARMELDQGVVSLFNYLKSKKVPIALVTDLTLAIQYRKLIALGLHDAFDCIVTSEECRTEKKSGAPFLLALEKMKMKPGADVWMVGDANSDMHGKTHINATTIFNNKYEKNTPKLAPDETISSMSDLQDICKKVFGE